MALLSKKKQRWIKEFNYSEFHSEEKKDKRCECSNRRGKVLQYKLREVDGELKTKIINQKGAFGGRNNAL